LRALSGVTWSRATCSAAWPPGWPTCANAETPHEVPRRYPQPLRPRSSSCVARTSCGELLRSAIRPPHERATDRALYDYVSDSRASSCATPSRCPRWRSTASCT
jgi:hypothetical protein